MDIRQALASCGEAEEPTSQALARFLQLALGLRFESRFVDETRWWPVPTEDVGRGLASYHQDLEQCLDRMLDGEILGSRLSVYRVATPDAAPSTVTLLSHLWA